MVAAADLNAWAARSIGSAGSPPPAAPNPATRPARGREQLPAVPPAPPARRPVAAQAAGGPRFTSVAGAACWLTGGASAGGIRDVRRGYGIGCGVARAGGPLAEGAAASEVATASIRSARAIGLVR